MLESSWGAVPGLLPIRFSRPLAEPAVPVSWQRALHGVSGYAWLGASQGILLPWYSVAGDRALPEIAGGEVLVKAHAAGLDRGTWHLMTGRPYLSRVVLGLRKPKNPVPGRDVAGTVTAVGASVTQFVVTLHTNSKHRGRKFVVLAGRTGAAQKKTGSPVPRPPAAGVWSALRSAMDHLPAELCPAVEVAVLAHDAHVVACGSAAECSRDDVVELGVPAGEDDAAQWARRTDRLRE